MRTLRATMIGILLLSSVTGCAATAPTPSPAEPDSTGTAATVRATPTATPSAATLFYEQDVCAGAVAAYDGVQQALNGTDAAAIRSAGAKGAELYTAALAKLEAYPWTADVKPLFTPYDAKARQQIAYYRSVAKANSLTAALDLPFPDGSAVTTPVETALHVPADGDYCSG
jgi:hypothetical protein